ncbi:porin family protein [Algibacillus agarilyticus]|uniref:porin family protein n=1 Tax=Algibacillus agarilyticus TaxID=2234133 RepID=UPI000DCF8B11|nr:porin family protein [Algibacillus agarilyticus]
MKIKLLTASLLFAVTASQTVFAQETPNASEISLVAHKSTGFHGSLGSVSLDAKAAYIGEVKDSATYWRLGWENHTDSFIWGTGLSGYLYSDKAGFTVRTEGAFGGESDSDSSATAFNGYIEGGYKYAVNDVFSVALLAGYELVLTSDRSVGYCSDCPSEDIDMDAGVYLQPRATFQFGNDWYASLDYNAYMSGDVESAVMLSVGAQY